MKALIEIDEKTFKALHEFAVINIGRSSGKTIIEKCLKAISNGTPIPDNATRAQVFEKIFGMKIDTTGDCGFFNCSDISSCHDCRVGQMKPLRDAYKIWWDAPYRKD